MSAHHARMKTLSVVFVLLCIGSWVFVAIAISYDFVGLMGLGQVSVMIVAAFILSGLLILYTPAAFTYEFVELQMEARRVRLQRQAEMTSHATPA